MKSLTRKYIAGRELLVTVRRLKTTTSDDDVATDCRVEARNSLNLQPVRETIVFHIADDERSDGDDDDDDAHGHSDVRLAAVTNVIDATTTRATTIAVARERK